MQIVRSLYPRILVFGSFVLAMPLVLALVPASGGAPAISHPVQTTAADSVRKLGPEDCRLDQYAHAPTCQIQGRTVRVIGF